MLSEIIAKSTKLPVEEVETGTKIRANRIYVIPPNAAMSIIGGVFELTPRDKAPGQHIIDLFMQSLSQERKRRAIGIIFSGTGIDGTSGLEGIKAEGGITFAQDPATAKYDGMRARPWILDVWTLFFRSKR
jgi:two-component system CheB/CheR fusion protein